MKLKPFFAAAKSADGGTLELSIYEDIGSDWFGDGCTAKNVKAQIDAAGDFNRISVRINSPGGDAFEGVAIFNLLRSLNKFIDVSIDGIAASAASIIAMAGDSITMGPNAMLMIHNAWTVCAGGAAEFRAQADVLDRVSAAIGKTYVARTGKSADEIKALMDAETWMGADEAVELGFATAIAETDDEERALALAGSFKALSRLKNVPEKLRAAVNNPPADAAEVPPPAAAIESNLSLYEAQLKLRGKR